MYNKTIELLTSDLQDRLPHRYPFFLIDRAKLFMDLTDGDSPKCIKAIKNVTVNEPYFTGHFPKKSILPGVIITEAMTQVTILFFEANGGYYVTSIKVRFLVPVVPGDQLEIEAVPIKLLSSAGIFKVKATVENKTVARGEIEVRLTEDWI